MDGLLLQPGLLSFLSEEIIPDYKCRTFKERTTCLYWRTKSGYHHLVKKLPIVDFEWKIGDLWIGDWWFMIVDWGEINPQSKIKTTNWWFSLLVLYCPYREGVSPNHKLDIVYNQIKAGCFIKPRLLVSCRRKVHSRNREVWQCPPRIPAI